MKIQIFCLTHPNGQDFYPNGGLKEISYPNVFYCMLCLYQLQYIICLIFFFFLIFFNERKVWQDAVDMEHKMKHLGWDKQILFEIWNPPWNERKQNIEIFVGSGWMWWFSFCNVAIVFMVLGNLAIFQVKILLNRF